MKHRRIQKPGKVWVLKNIIQTLGFLIIYLCSINTYAVGYIYDTLGRLDKITYDNGATIKYEYDAAGNILVITNDTSNVDTDGDGLLDAEDFDDDNDAVLDTADACSTGVINWTSNSTTDNDGDGCRDIDEDLDDDNDGLTDIEEQELGTDPTNKDTDRDGLDDGWEIDNSLDPLDGFCPSYLCGGLGSWRHVIPLIEQPPEI